VRGSAFDPLVVPPEFWTRAEVVEVLCARDISGLFLLLRRLLGASQFRIGLATEIGQHRVSRIMNRQTRVGSLELLERIASGLGMPNNARALLGLAPVAEASPRPDVAGMGADSARTVAEVQRRDLVFKLAALGGGAVAWTAPFDAGAAPSDRHALSQALNALDQLHTSLSPVDDWNETVWEYGHAYVTAPRRALFDQLLDDVASIHVTMARVTDDRALKSLADAGGRLAALLAMVCTDLGFAREARTTWRLARRLTDQGDCADSQLWVRGQEAITGLYLDRPMPTIHALVDEGLARAAGRPLAGRAILLAARAQAYAREGRTVDAVAALPPLERAFETLPDSGTRFKDSIFGWSEGRFWHTISYVRSTCGSVTESHAATDAALSRTDPSRVISRAQLDLHHAIRLLHDGDVNGGVQRASGVLDALPTPQLGRYVGTIAAHVLQTVPKSGSWSSSHADLRQRVVAAFPDLAASLS
jgi:hypothetical protein